MTARHVDRYITALVLAAFAGVLLLANPVLAQSGNSVTVLHEGYDRFPSVGATVTLVRGDGVIIVCDPGMVKDQALIVDALSAEGLAPGDVTHVFLTHHHPDHSINVGLFPEAKVVDTHSIYDGDHWGEHSGDGFELAPGVSLMATPGHTAEDISLIVETEDGVYVITHAWWHSDFTPQIDPFAEDQAALDESRARILDVADWIVPGHGPAVKNPDRP